MPVSPIEIEGIYNIAAKDPVNQIAHGATEDKTVSDGFSFMTIFKDQLDQKNRDHYELLSILVDGGQAAFLSD